MFPVASCLLSIYMCSRRLSIPTTEEDSQWYAFTLMIFNNQRDGRVVSENVVPECKYFLLKTRRARPSFPFRSILFLTSYPKYTERMELFRIQRRLMAHFFRSLRRKAKMRMMKMTMMTASLTMMRCQDMSRLGWERSQKDPNIGKG